MQVLSILLILGNKTAGIWDASQTTMIQILFSSGCLHRIKSAIFFQRGQCSRPYLICCLISSINYDNKMITRLPWPNKRLKAIPFPFTTSCSGVFGLWGPLESTQPAPYGWYTTRQPTESEIAGDLLLRSTFCHTLLAVQVVRADSRYHKNPHPALPMVPHLYHPCMVCSVYWPTFGWGELVWGRYNLTRWHVRSLSTLEISFG